MFNILLLLFPLLLLPLLLLSLLLLLLLLFLLLLLLSLLLFLLSLQVNDLAKLGLLALMIRTYYSLIGTHFYLDLMVGIVFSTSFDQFFDWFLSGFWWLWVVSWSHFWWFMIYHVYMIMYDIFHMQANFPNNPVPFTTKYPICGLLLGTPSYFIIVNPGPEPPPMHGKWTVRGPKSWTDTVFGRPLWLWYHKTGDAMSTNVEKTWRRWNVRGKRLSSNKPRQTKGPRKTWSLAKDIVKLDLRTCRVFIVIIVVIIIYWHSVYHYHYYY